MLVPGDILFVVFVSASWIDTCTCMSPICVPFKKFVFRQIPLYCLQPFLLCIFTCRTPTFICSRLFYFLPGLKEVYLLFHRTVVYLKLQTIYDFLNSEISNWATAQFLGLLQIVMSQTDKFSVSYVAVYLTPMYPPHPLIVDCSPAFWYTSLREY